MTFSNCMYVYIFPNFISGTDTHEELTIITSGKGKSQLLISGYRPMVNTSKMRKNRLTSYFRCIRSDCPARALTRGKIDPENVQLKYHNVHPNVHNHPPDEVGNLLALHRHNYRQSARENPQQSPKVAYDKVTEKLIDSLSSPIREEFLQRMAPYENSKDQFYRVRKRCQAVNKRCKVYKKQ